MSIDSIKIAEQLLKIGSIKLSINEPFTWVSGIKSPIYCDNRKVMSDIDARETVINAFCSLIKDTYPDADIIMGVATGGIPYGALIADRLRLPFCYVRQEPKKHGLMRQVEGEYTEGDKIVLIEDLISTGGSSLKAINGVRNANLKLLGLVSIMTYNFEASKVAFADNKVDFHCLSNMDAVVEAAQKSGNITEDEKTSILSFKDDPKAWGDS